MTRFTGRQITVMVVALSTAVVAAPVTALAANTFGGHGPSYYAHIVPLSWTHAPEPTTFHGIAIVRGVVVYASCKLGDTGALAQVSVAAHTDADAGTINVFTVRSTLNDTRPSTTGPAVAFGKPLTATPLAIARTDRAEQIEGTATYRRDSDGRVVTIEFHAYADATCEVFGNVITQA